LLTTDLRACSFYARCTCISSLGIASLGTNTNRLPLLLLSHGDVAGNKPMKQMNTLAALGRKFKWSLKYEWLLQGTAGSFLRSYDVTATAAAIAGGLQQAILTKSPFVRDFPALSSDPANSPSTVRVDYTCLCDTGNYPAINSTTGVCSPCPAGGLIHWAQP